MTAIGCLGGHCWHENDGTPYQRNNTRPIGDEVRVTCCWCKVIRQMPTHANCGPAAPLDVKHGPHVP